MNTNRWDRSRRAVYNSRLDAARPAAFTRVDLLGLLVAGSLLALLQLAASSLGAVPRDAAGCLANLRRLTQAWLFYADDHRGYLPGNNNDLLGRNWVGGYLDFSGAPGNTNVLYLVDPRYAQLGPYSRDPALYRCPADLSRVRMGPQLYLYPRVRSYSMNEAVGTKPDGRSPVDGPWLDGHFSHRANQIWHTYGSLADLVAPAPSRLWVLIDEDEYSINDGGFAVTMTRPEQMIDWPATRHDLSGALSFADGHAELHRWRDPRTLVSKGDVTRTSQPNNPDIVWLQERTSVRVPAN